MRKLFRRRQRVETCSRPNCHARATAVHPFTLEPVCEDELDDILTGLGL